METTPPPPQAPPNEQQLPPQQQLPPLPSPAASPLTSFSTVPTSLSLPASSLPPRTATETAHSANPTLNPTTKSPALQIPHSQNPQSRPASQPSSSFSMSWQQPSPFHHFSLPPPPPLPGPHSAFATPSSSSLSMLPPGGGVALGVPAHHPGPPPPPASFSSLAPPSFSQQFGGLARNVPDSVPTSSSSQVRHPIQGRQGVGIMGAFGSSSPIRSAGVPPHPLRSITSSLRAQAGTNCQFPGSQNFQGNGMLRVPPVGSQIFPSTSQTPQSQNQPWLSSTAQGKPPFPTHSLRPQMSPQLLQQRSLIPSQHHHTMSTSQQQQLTSSAQQSQPSSSSPSPENLAQKNQLSRNQQSFPNQSPIARGQGLGSQRLSSHATLQPSAVQAGSLSRTAAMETEEPCNRILSKRSIQELVTQIDPLEKLDPEVEDILVDIAEDFVESITIFGCSLAKHRKSSMLEAKDVLLNVERNWNISLPGFSGDEIRAYKKPFTTDIHRERLAVIKKSIVGAEATNSKSTAGQGGNLKSHLGKGPANILSPSNAKT